MTTYTIFLHRLDSVRESITALNSRAQRAGLDTRLDLRIVRVFVRIHKCLDGSKVSTHLAEVELLGEAPVVAGWAFVARLEWLGADAIISRPPSARLDEIDLSAYYHGDPTCNHCHQARQRKITYLLADVSALGEGRVELRQIGSSCLELYLGATPEGAVRLFNDYEDLLKELGANLDSDSEWSGPRSSYVGLVDYVACAISAIRHHGFRPTASESSTRDHAMFLMYPPHLNLGKLYDEWQHEQPTDTDRQQAQVMLNWLSGVEESSEYIHNLRTACADGYTLHVRHQGLVASLPRAYAKAHDDLVAKTKAAELPHEYWSSPKVRSTVEATVQFVTTYETSTESIGLLVRFRAGNADLLWFASSGICSEWEVGKTYTVKATVKAHEKDRRSGLPVTIVNRVAKVAAKTA